MRCLISGQQNAKLTNRERTTKCNSVFTKCAEERTLLKMRAISNASVVDVNTLSKKPRE